MGTYYAVSADWYTCAVNNQNKRDSEKTFTGVKLSVTPDKEASGDIGGFAALATALAATIGTGNIVGVATAIGIGGPGAVFWMWFTGLLGMATKFGEGIRVNAICPGQTMGTELTKNSLSTNPHEEAMLKEHVIPMKKLATTQEVVNAVLWLSSDQASHTTGQKIFIDGGMHIA